MSRAKKELPESLELLLDTMCNTFGGIMFIALALIIIYQLVTKQLKEMTPEEIDRKRIEQLNASIKELETEVKLRDSNIYTDSKILDLYKYVDGKFAGVEAQICQQSVINTQVAANLSCMQGNISTLMGLTKTIIPITNVCPQPMPEFNSWTAPTTTGA
jgi:hypothetical protein